MGPSSALRLARRFAVAPMMRYTTPEFRYLFRLISPSSLLFTEMVTARAVCAKASQGLLERKLYYDDPAEHPVALQLGGCDADDLARATDIGAHRLKFDEINLNVGCPSERVAGSGGFGASLMKDIEHTSSLSRAMVAAAGGSGAPVTIKCRVGVDAHDSDEHLHRFIEANASAGVETFYVHARKAISGLSTKANRTVPPLEYERVFRVARAFPELDICINGGIQDLAEAEDLLSLPAAAGGASSPSLLSGVMVGRAVAERPFDWWGIESRLFGHERRGSGTTAPSVVDRKRVIRAYADHLVQRQHSEAVAAAAREGGGGDKGEAEIMMAAPQSTARAVVQPILTAFAGVNGNKRYRRRADELLQQRGATVHEVVEACLAEIGDDEDDGKADDNDAHEGRSRPQERAPAPPPLESVI